MNTTPHPAATTRHTQPRSRRQRPAECFARLCDALVRRLPFGLATRIAPSVLGFAAINGFTFGVDLTVLTVLHGMLGWPLWLAITISYLAAFGLSFALNRTLNFRSHGPLGRQTGFYLAAITINYVVFLLGVGTGLTTLGVPYQPARLIAGACEGAFMYSVLRWIVFATPQQQEDHDPDITRPPP